MAVLLMMIIHQTFRAVAQLEPQIRPDLSLPNSFQFITQNRPVVWLPYSVSKSSIIHIVYSEYREYIWMRTQLLLPPNFIHITTLCVVSSNFNDENYVEGTRGSVVVKALCCKPEGRGFDTR
jgi:hypothetical protein